MRRRTLETCRTKRTGAVLVRLGMVAGLTLQLLMALPVTAQERRQPGQRRAARPPLMIAAGGQHTLFVSGGDLYAWGDNSSGQLGIGLAGPFQTVPVRVSRSSALVRVVAVAAGVAHSVALDGNGEIWTWGDNSQGQLGDGTRVSRAAPVRLAGIPGLSGRVTAIAAGDQFTLALTVAGEVWTWGDNTWGQLGDGTILDRLVPTPITGVVDVKALSAGGGHALALDVRGRIWAWGRNNRGQIGDGGTVARTLPVELFAGDPSRHCIEIAAGLQHSLGLDDHGLVLAWGADDSAQLGNGPVTGDQLLPVAVSPANGFLRAVHIAAGGEHSLALTARGRVYGWGADGEGQVGDGASLPAPAREVPTVTAGITGLPGATAIAAGHLHSAALLSNGSVAVWGSNLSGQVGNDSPVAASAPVVLPGVKMRGMLCAAAAWKQSYTLGGDGTIWAFGDNLEGQLGDGTATSRWKPRQVDGLTDVIALSVNTSNVLGLRADGTVWAWGKNQSGQVGLPPNTGWQCPSSLPGNVCRPLQVGAGVLTDVKAVAAGTYFHLALQADGSVWSWGANSSGQLGRGTGLDDPVPRVVPGLDGVISLAGGGGHGLALLSGGTVKAWGRDTNCELGVANCCAHNGAGVTRCNNPIAQPDVLVPTDVRGQNGAGLLSRIVAVNAGLYHHSLALDINGRVWTWGDDSDGQLGDGNSGPFWVGSFPGRVLDPSAGSGLLDDVTAIAAGASHSTAMRPDGTVSGWGLDAQGQLGDGPPTSLEPYPVSPACLDGVTGLASGAGLRHTDVLRHDGSVCAAGLNDMGQLADPVLTTTDTFACDHAPVGSTVRVDTINGGRIVWDPVPSAQSYRVYRGSASGGGSAFIYNHSCLTPAGVMACPAVSAPCPPEFFDAAVPTTPGALLYYLVVSRRGVCGEDDPGRDSRHQVRPMPLLCP
ncbi:MAG: RCC1 repeat-containing protein [Acidobacteriota bacterium]